MSDETAGAAAGLGSRAVSNAVFILVIGYDSTGVWLNDPGISWGRGYHISYAQLAHAIDSLDQHHPALNQGQVLLVVAPEAPIKNRHGELII